MRQSAEVARSHSYNYIWIDTLCIDKSSSAELSEAINSMFKWYARSGVCYAYLFDVAGDERSNIRGCKWLTRGWTLQELIAPSDIVFFNRRWRSIGNRYGLAEELESTTGIDYLLLRSFGRTEMSAQSILASISVASRLFWASKRRTTRAEDAAYCLMGLYNVNMPLLYGEGEKAFARLQEEIIKVTTDTSILALTGVLVRGFPFFNTHYLKTLPFGKGYILGITVLTPPCE